MIGAVAQPPRLDSALGYGVAYVSYGGYFGSGALLYDGQTVITSAHLFSEQTSGSVSVWFAGATLTDSVLPNQVFHNFMAFGRAHHF